MTDAHEQPEEPTIDRRSADIGIVCTHAAEVNAFVKQLDRVKKYAEGSSIFRGGFINEVVRVAIVEAGPGFAVHRRVTETLIEEHNPPWILSVGFSSALTAQLQSGDVCLANEICDTHGNALPVNCKIPESRRIFVRKHVVADHHPRTAEEKKALNTYTEAVACDTTSLAVAQACNERSTEERPIRFLSIRGIIDSETETLTSEGLTYCFEPVVGDRPKLVSGLMNRFKPNPALKPWQDRANDVSLNMNRFLLSTVKQIADKLGKSI